MAAPSGSGAEAGASVVGRRRSPGGLRSGLLEEHLLEEVALYALAVPDQTR